MKLASLFLGLWLVLTGLGSLIDLHFKYDDLVLAILAITAGVLSILRQ